MAYQRDYLLNVGREGFQLIDACYGPSGGSGNTHLPPLVEPDYHYHPQENHSKYVYSGPQTHTVLQKPVSNSTTYVYQVQHQVTAVRRANQAPIPASKHAARTSNLMPATQGQGGRNAYQLPQIVKPKEPVTWYVYEVDQVPTGKEDVITCDQAAKIYGGFIRKESNW